MKKKTAISFTTVLIILVVIFTSITYTSVAFSKDGYKIHACWFSNTSYCSGNGSDCAHRLACTINDQ